MRFTTVFFDLDGTLYPGDNGLWEAIGARMNDFICNRLGVPQSEVAQLREKYYLAYGTTLQGLKRFHEVDELEYLQYVHDVPLEDYVAPDPELQEMLERMPQAKWIFTNGDRNHARRVTAALGVQDCFAGVVDILAMGGVNKPDGSVYRLAMEAAGVNEAGKCVYVDDVPHNLEPARALGMFTVLVGTAPNSVADRCIRRVGDLLEGVPELLE